MRTRKDRFVPATYCIGMKNPTEIKYDHYRQMFLGARANREQIRASIAMPVTAAAFTVFNLGTIVQNFEVSRWQEPVAIAIGLLSIVSVFGILATLYCTVRVEWHFVHVEPPDLPEIVRIERQIREEHPDIDSDHLPSTVSAELQNLLTGSYYVGYESYLMGNARSTWYRMWALRLVLLALACVSIAFLLLPFHLGGGATGGGTG